MLVNPKGIILTRLQAIPVKGNFTINCDSVEDFLFLRHFFDTDKNYIHFKNIRNIKEDREFLKVGKPETHSTDLRFFIKYESLNELLKLREIFNIRASKFDMYLIEKRKYNPFTKDFYARTADQTIYKVNK